MPALIKVDEIRTKLAKKIRYRNYSKLVQFFWEKAQCVCTLVKIATKRPFFLGTPQLDKAMDQSGAPLRLMLRPPLSTKVPFVRFDPAVSPLHGDKGQIKDSHIS